MTKIKTLLDHLDITVLNAELITVGTEWNYRNVNNPYSRIYYITEGHGTLQHHGQDYRLEPGYLYLIPCYTPVTLFAPDRFTHYVIHFTSRLQIGMDILSLFTCTYQVNANDCGITPAILNRLLEINTGKEFASYNPKHSIYQQVLERAEKLDQDQSPSAQLETNGLMRLLLAAFFSGPNQNIIQNTLEGLARFEPIFDYIQIHMDTPIELEELADLVDLSPPYFSSQFSQLMGLTPIQYLQKRRIEEAQTILLSSKQSIKDIAAQVGFEDTKSFSRIFKRLVGTAATHYRQNNKSILQR